MAAGCVLASLRGSAYHSGKRLFREAMGGRGERYMPRLCACCDLAEQPL